MTDGEEEGLEDSKQVRVAMRSRRVLGPAGYEVEIRVPCPLRGREMTLEECSVCSRLQDLVVTPDGRGAFLRCLMPASLGSSPSGEGLASGAAANISEVMTTHIVCVRPELDVVDLGAVFLQSGISGVPVVDWDGRPLGMVSKTDLLRICCGEATLQRGSATVSDIMMPVVLCLPANESVARAAALMAFEKVHRVPVVGPSGQVVGIVSSLDVLRWMARQHGYVLAD